MANFILLMVCLMLGMVFRRTGILPAQTPKVLNSIIIYISLPAITLLYLHDFRFSAEIVLPVIMPWIYFGISYLIFTRLGKHFRWDRKTTGVMILLGGLGNTSFVGLPMIEVFWGKGGIPIGLMIDQFGSFLVLSTFGIIIASKYSGSFGAEESLFKKVLTFPPFLSIIGAFILMPVEYPEIMKVILERLGMTLSPLALMSVGYQLHFEKRGGIRRELITGLAVKLIMLPAIIFLLYRLVLDSGSMVYRVTVFEAAMPPMITAAIVATEYGLNSKLANLLVGIGIIAAFMTLSIWYGVLLI
ncbi:MAG: AEC family transporter [Ignavibacteriaceae bacterium]|nr:AEC family transporter [Ignavibacteriaceae bacterium]